MNWTEIVSQLGIVSLISGLIVWLIKALGQRMIDKNAKIHEQELKNKSEQFKSELNIALERFKSDLSFLFQKAYKLHDKRLERIETIYSLLVDFYNDMATLTTGKLVTGMTKEQIEKQERDNTAKAATSGSSFLSYYSKNKLYFNKSTCVLIEEIIASLQSSYADFSFKYIFGLSSPEREYERIRGATENIKIKVPKIQQELENNFRGLIGSDAD